MKTILKLTAAAAILIGGLGATSTALADNNGGDNPQEHIDLKAECESLGRTWYQSDDSDDGNLSVAITRPGTVWVKTGSHPHFAIPTVSVGEIYTPGDVSSWPANGQEGKFQQVSHVDYCVPTPRIEICLIEPYNGIFFSDFEYGVGDDNDHKGTTRWTVTPCFVEVPNVAVTTPPVPTTTTTTTVTASATLPETGSNLSMAIVASTLVAAGIAALLASRRRWVSPA